MTYWVEIRTTVHRKGPPRLVPLADVDKYRGFRSVFAYPEHVAQLIREQGGTQGLRGCEVYADVLLLDFDNHTPDEFLKWLDGSGLAFERYDSGGRSVHLHILMMPVVGSWVPSACKEWVKQHAPTADISFYHPAGVYRLPLTFHAKHPGRCKTLLERREGMPLSIQQPAKAPSTFRLDERGSQEEFFLLLTQRKGEGHRQPHLWRLAVTGFECGLSFDEVLEHAEWWSERFCDPPHPAEVIRRQVESAYRNIQRREA